MPQHIGTIQPQFVVALSEMEVDIIVTALLESGHVELAEDFEDAAYGGCECEECEGV